jgi:signal transduction histidine kinase/PAS domain-containing protein
MRQPLSDARHAEQELFAGASEMHARCRDVDWGATPLGPVERWPASLRIAAQIVLDSGLPNVLLWGPELIQLYNDAYSRIIQAKHPMALGRGNQEIWPEVWHINGPICERVFRGETVTVDDALYPLARAGEHGETEDVYLTISFSPVRDETGAVAGVLANMIETTTTVQRRALEAERERLVRALQVEQSRLSYVFERAPTYLAVLRGPSHVFTRINDAYLQLVGQREVIGKPVADALPEVVEQGFVELLDAVFRTGEPYVGREVSVMLQRTPGAPLEERFVDFIFQPQVESDGAGGSRITGVVAHGSDITEQVRARHDVECARDRFARLQTLTAALAAATTPEAVADVVAAQGVVATGAATGLLALRVPDSVHPGGEGVTVRQTGLDAVIPASDPRFSNGRFPLSNPGPAGECIRTGAAFFLESREAVLARFPEILEIWGRLGTHALATVPLEVAGEVVGAMSFTFTQAHPFSPDDREFFLSLGRQCAQALERARLFAAEREEHQRAERARVEADAARRRAEEANRAKAEFLAVMSHELRTPLNAIGGYAELIELGIHGPVTSEQMQALARIQTSQRHLLGLINSVLNYTRVEAGAVHYSIADVPIGEVLVTCEALIAPQAQAKRLATEYRACGPALRVRADRDKVQQIVLNLLSNAVKFTEPGGRIEIGCAARDSGVAVRITDTGRGIPIDQLERVFQPFTQVDAKLTRTQEGVGLGLAISRDLARAMGGDITVESEEGAGSTFTLTLPRA